MLNNSRYNSLILFLVNCWSGEFESSARCVEALFNQCRQSQQISLLYKLVDPDKIRLSFDKICGKLDLYSKSKVCIMRQDSKIKRCFHDVEYVFHDNIAKARYVDHVILTYCGFQLGLRDCIVQPVTTACGKDIGGFMNDFMDGVTAPVCMKDIYGNSASCNIPELTLLSLMTPFILSPFL
ncbi:hypothetical protein LOTGIDRAFT_160286 [Lottia gigantea]|uniref:Uncharacterized protein n=1 Tax=Lottia gigantea TaxID=225164 RepID=V4AQ11_LOTGI|nr:hypothetical protein LOTGIDRAFT_160286 [Lottia gigantea]ESO95741.1 hypothetical protein LOTGIDRAFT_160286 [Lottia gigantea]